MKPAETSSNIVSEEYPVLAPVLDTLKRFERMTGSKPAEIRVTSAQWEQLKRDMEKLPDHLRPAAGMGNSLLGVTIKIDDRMKDAASGKGGREPVSYRGGPEKGGV